MFALHLLQGLKYWPEFSCIFDLVQHEMLKFQGTLIYDELYACSVDLIKQGFYESID